MAEIAVAAAISVVEAVLFFLHESDPKFDAHDFSFVREWLPTVEAYLKDTEGREGTEGSKDRVKQVRDVAYDIEDFVEEFMLQMPQHSHHHRITRLLGRAAHKVKDMRPLHRLSSRLKAIKDKIKDIEDWDKFRVIPPHHASPSGSGGQDYPQVYPSPRDDELVGIDSRRRKLLNHMMGGEQQLVVISVVGSRGSGKTTLMKDVYHKEKACFESSAWIAVPHPCGNIPGRVSAALGLYSQGTEIGNKLRSYLRGRRYIIFLDGIWSKEEWNCIKDCLPDGNNGSRVIISTHTRDVASYCSMPLHHIYELGDLTWEESKELFCKKAFQQAEMPHHLAEWSEKILIKCEKLPLAIVAVSSLLSTKPQNPSAFKRLHDSIGYELVSNPSLRRILLESYYHLSYNLRWCFLYFCNFPEDCSAISGRLIRMWIAERFVKKTRGKTLEEVAEEYLNDLIQMGLVLVTRRSFDGKVRSCRVHNLVREFLLSKSEKDNFCKVFKGSCTSSDGRPRRLSLHESCTNPFIGDLSHIRTFMMFRIDNFSKSPAGEFLEGFKLLRVLDFENANLEKFPKKIIVLTLLRYLSLRKTKVKEIPGSIEKLQNLETLDLRETLISKLPKNILELQKLLYLLVDSRDVNGDSTGVELVPRVGSLRLLQKLSLVRASKNRQIVKELGDLIELRKLGVSELKKEDEKDLCASIQKMEHLSSLHVSSTCEEETFLDLDYMSRPPSLIRRLHLTGHLKKIPQWIGLLQAVAKICLKRSRLDRSPLEILHYLPSLVELQLVDAYNGEMLEFRAGWFKELRMLEIRTCSQLHSIEIQEGAMPELRKMVVRECKKLKLVPLGIDWLTKLEERDMPDLITL